MQAAPRISIRKTVFSDGERYPVLVDNLGVPLWYPTLYVTTQVRNASKAPNTLGAVLGAIRMLILWAEEREVALETRFGQGRFLSESEIESLRTYTQSRAESSSLPAGVVRLPRTREDSRANPQQALPRVSGQTQYIRLTYISDYLEWLARRLIERDRRQLPADVAKEIESMGRRLRARRPAKKGRSGQPPRKGLTPNQRTLLLELVRPSANRNPFRSPVQMRNCLAINLLYHLGMRQGELLGLRINEDLDLRENTIRIARRHDDQDDPRTDQPVAKTHDRTLPLSNDLARLVQDYILYSRRKVPNARRHDFLLVTHQRGANQGKPLSAKGLAKIFSRLRQIAPEELPTLTPHQLRHDWNDRFSEQAERNGWDHAAEEKMRSYAMGWKEGSGSSAVYTKRYTERKAQDAALRLQESTHDRTRDA